MILVGHSYYICITMTSGIRYATIRVNVCHRDCDIEINRSLSVVFMYYVTYNCWLSYSFKMSSLLIDLYFVSDNLLKCVYLRSVYLKEIF